jgi:hypothetical protein
MVRLLLRSFTFSNVCSFLALTIALGTGTAYAANTIGSDDIIDESIQGIDIKNGQVRSADILNGGVGSVDLGADSVNATQIADGSVGTLDLGSNAVTGAKVANNSLTTADIAGADVDGGSISIPTGFVPNGRCRQLDASVGGAKAGEAVIFNTKAALQDGILLYGQRVPSDGHVTFSACNFSGTTQAAISSIPVRVITFG